MRPQWINLSASSGARQNALLPATAEFSPPQCPNRFDLLSLLLFLLDTVDWRRRRRRLWRCCCCCTQWWRRRWLFSLVIAHDAGGWRFGASGNTSYLARIICRACNCKIRHGPICHPTQRNEPRKGIFNYLNRFVQRWTWFEYHRCDHQCFPRLNLSRICHLMSRQRRRW